MGRWVIIPTWKNWSFLFYYEFVMIRRLQKTAAKILLACIALGAMATASNVPSPAPNGVLYDEDRLLSAQEAEFLRALVTEVYLKTDVKIAAVLMNDSRTNETYAYAKEVANKWRLEGSDTKGILVYVSMKERSKHVIASEGFSTSYPREPEFKQIAHNDNMTRAPFPRAQQFDKFFFSVGQTSRGINTQVSIRNEIRNFIHQAQCNKI